MSIEVLQNEIKGYHNFAKESGWDEWKFDEQVNSGKKSKYFNYLLGLIKNKGKTVLDFGSGTCWTSQILSENGFDVVSLEMNGSDVCGVGVVRNKEKKFEVVMGDCENSPIKGGSFDVVFCHQVLHHADDLDRMVKELVGCCKRDGMIVVGGEHIRPWFVSDELFRKSHPAVKFGANEHAYTYKRYRDAFKKAGIDVDVIPRGFECEFETIKQNPIRLFVVCLNKLKMRWIVKWMLLNFSGAGTEITIHGTKN